MGNEADQQRKYGVQVIDNDAAYIPFTVTDQTPAYTDPVLRIGVSGAQGTGITTTARGLAQRLNVPLMTEVARTAFEHGFTLGDEGSIKAQCAMWFSQAFIEHREPNFVSDRTVVDAVAHAEMLADITGDKYDRLVATAMGNATAAAMRSFSALFYTPIEFELSFDGVRKGDQDFQMKLDGKFAEIIERLQLPYVILRGTVDERLDQAMEVINKLQK